MVLCRVSWKRAERHQGHPQGHRAASEPGGKAGVVQPHNSKHSPGKAGQRLHPSSTGDPRETAAKEPLRGPDKDMGSGEAGETPQGAEGADSGPLWHQKGPIPCPCSHPTPLDPCSHPGSQLLSASPAPSIPLEDRAGEPSLPGLRRTHKPFGKLPTAIPKTTPHRDGAAHVLTGQRR